MEYDLNDAIPLLARTPAALNALLRDLPEVWTRSKEGENTWSVFDVVGHLAHCERVDWMQRAKIILEFGELTTFKPLDRTGFQEKAEATTLAQRLDDFARLRTENLAELRGLNLRTQDLDRRGRHPVFGPVTLSQLFATWTAHDLNHLHQISRILAHQYRDEVGPWTAYLGVMHCEGHSSA